MKEFLIIVFILIGITAVVLAIVVPLYTINKKYKNFITQHSCALKNLDKINHHYKFNSVRNFDMSRFEPTIDMAKVEECVKSLL